LRGPGGPPRRSDGALHIRTVDLGADLRALPDEWVCLVEIDEINDTDFEFRTARVVGHVKTRSEPFDQAWPWQQRYTSMGHHYTGRIVAPFPRFS